MKAPPDILSQACCPRPTLGLPDICVEMKLCSSGRTRRIWMEPHPTPWTRMNCKNGKRKGHKKALEFQGASDEMWEDWLRMKRETSTLDRGFSRCIIDKDRDAGRQVNNVVLDR